MDKKKILILGAGIYQLPLIRKAKEMGLHVLVASVAGEYPGFALADEIFYVDTTDKEKILELARKEKISGICTTGTDVAVITIGYVCDKLGLKGLSMEAAGKATDKAVMKEAFRKGKVSTADFRVIDSLEAARKAFGELKKPVILKIVDKSGSRGIIKVEREEELEAAYEKAGAYTGRSYMVLEEYIEGLEIGVDAFVQDGVLKMFMPHNKLMYDFYGTGIPVGHIFPCELTEGMYEKLREETKKVIRALGLDNCAVNMDVFLSGEQIYVIEAGGRAGATCIPELVSIYGGFDFYEKILRNALGEETEFEAKPPTPCASMLLYAEKSGVFQGMEIREEERMSYSLDIEQGHAVEKMENGTNRIGQVLLWDADRDRLLEKLERVQKSIRVSVRED